MRSNSTHCHPWPSQQEPRSLTAKQCTTASFGTGSFCTSLQVSEKKKDAGLQDRSRLMPRKKFDDASRSMTWFAHTNTAGKNMRSCYATFPCAGPIGKTYATTKKKPQYSPHSDFAAMKQAKSSKREDRNCNRRTKPCSNRTMTSIAASAASNTTTHLPAATHTIARVRMSSIRWVIQSSDNNDQ